MFVVLGKKPPTSDLSLQYIWARFECVFDHEVAYDKGPSVLIVVPIEFEHDTHKSPVALAFSTDFKCSVQATAEFKESKAVKELQAFVEPAFGSQDRLNAFFDQLQNADKLIKLLLAACGVKPGSGSGKPYDPNRDDYYGGRNKEREPDAPDVGIRSSVLPFVAAIVRWEKRTGQTFPGKDALIQKLGLSNVYNWQTLVKEAETHNYFGQR